MKRILFAAAVAATPAFAQDHGQSPSQPYAGFQTREIKGLSESDIAQLRDGSGWGLALPAELNGRPGPAHLLELKDEIGLSPEQVAAIQETYDAMKAEAIPAGARLIDAERALSDAFAAGDVTTDRLAELLAESEAARAELRAIHLSRHIETPPLLTETQIARYNVLRGYADDPCEAVPAGHDPDMWRMHNGCT
jgi:hypothetical protein